ncbi:thiol reductant ABC exporter subunit CydC [Corynebacterium comes]|uniref:ABC transporter ATP-binding protein n=1 Tax=Corynebacterium comes TaxID=2675218 RepID=A0A6B8VJC3_9CORY|nr:thiol reductant ABC exporter subunit CydC [Corynebacterium comes]QGU05462.1 putative ABC transporter ATP-binding protein [Corynebacterium comes]
MRLLHFAGVRRRDLVLAVLAGSVTLLSALSLTVLSGWLITRAWEMPPVLDLSVAITAVRALGISRAVFRYLERLVSHRLALSALTTLRSRLFTSLAADSSGRGHLLTRGDGLVALVSDTERVTDLIVRSIVPRGVALVVSVAAVLGAGLLQPLAGLVLGLGFLVTGVAVPRLAVKAARSARRADAADDWSVALDEILDNRIEFEAAGLGDARIRASTAASARSSLAQVASDRPLAPAAAARAWSTGLAAVIILAIGALTYTGDPMWLGMMVMLPLAGFESHGQLAAAAIHADEARGAERRLSELMAGTGGVSMSGDLPGLHLRAHDLRCAFGERTWDVDLAPGERLIIRGPSGSGKTTLLLTLAGLVPPRSGEVTLGGRDLAAIAPERLRAAVRVHTEDEWLFATTIRENLRVANPTVDDATMRETLDAVGLGAWAGDLDLVLADGAGSLSSGQRRRLLLARALCSDAPVLLLDEPTAHISAEDAAGLLAMLERDPLPGARADRSVVVVTHEEQ